MKIVRQNNKRKSAYSAPLCVLMLLLAGMLVKLGPAIHVLHLAGN